MNAAEAVEQQSPTLAQRVSALHRRWLFCQTCDPTHCIHHAAYVAAKRELEEQEAKQP